MSKEDIKSNKPGTATPTTGDKPVEDFTTKGGSPPEGSHVEQKGGYKSPNYGSSSTVMNQQQAADMKVPPKKAPKP
jgi:hypothetical protein